MAASTEALAKAETEPRTMCWGGLGQVMQAMASRLKDIRPSSPVTKICHGSSAVSVHTADGAPLLKWRIDTSPQFIYTHLYTHNGCDSCIALRGSWLQKVRRGPIQELSAPASFAKKQHLTHICSHRSQSCHSCFLLRHSSRSQEMKHQHELIHMKMEAWPGV